MYNSKIKASSFLKRRNSSSQAAPFYPKFHLNEEKLFSNNNSVDFFFNYKKYDSKAFFENDEILHWLSLLKIYIHIKLYLL